MRELTVRQAAEARRSIRKYTAEQVTQETLREILRNASLAPSPDNLQPWRVIVVREHEMKQRLMAAAMNQRQVGSASAVLVLYTDMQDVIDRVDEAIHPGIQGEKREQIRERIPADFAAKGEAERDAWGYAIGYIFLGFLLLAAQSVGVSSSPMLGFEPEKVKQLFGLPAHVRLPALVALGYADEEGFRHHRHDLEGYVRWV